MRCHPKNRWISNTIAARMLIFMTRHRLPVVSRLFMYFLGCDIGLALPKTVFLPHPMGIVIHSDARIGDDVVIGHQVTLGGRELTVAVPQVEDGVYIGAGARFWAPCGSAAGRRSGPMPWSPGMCPQAPPSSAPTACCPSAAITRSIEALRESDRFHS